MIVAGNVIFPNPDNLVKLLFIFVGQLHNMGLKSILEDKYPL